MKLLCLLTWGTKCTTMNLLMEKSPLVARVEQIHGREELKESTLLKDSPFVVNPLKLNLLSRFIKLC